MAAKSQAVPTTKTPHFATLLVMALAPEEIGRRIKEAREAKGLRTHDEFLQFVRDGLNDDGIGLRTVQRWQKGCDPNTGKSWLPRLQRLMDLADLLEVPRSHFVEGGQDEVDVWHQVLQRLSTLEQNEERNTEMLVELLRRLRGPQDEPQSEEEPG